MAIDDCKLTVEEREVLKIKYYRYIDNDNSFWCNLKRKYEFSNTKRVTKEWINIVKSWVFDCPYECKVVRDSIHFGNYEKDGWIYYYDWVKGSFGTITRQILDEEGSNIRKQASASKKENRDLKKCQQWNLHYEDIGCTFKHIYLKDVRIKWTGIEDRCKEFPIEFYDYQENKYKLMTLDYFKARYVKEINEHE